MSREEEDWLEEEIEYIAHYLRQEFSLNAELQFRTCVQRLKYKKYRVNPNFGDSFSAIVQQDPFCKNCKKTIDRADPDIRNSFKKCVTKLIKKN